MKGITLRGKNCRLKLGRRVINSKHCSRRVCQGLLWKLILGIAMLSALAACGASSKAFTGTTEVPGTPAAAPSLSLKASESSVLMGDTVTLQWNAANVQSCDASGGWSGAQPPSGT